MRWEAVCLTLARRARINVPDHALHVIDGKAVLVIDRFDRDDQRRVGYISAMTMLEVCDNDGRSYLEIADAIEQHSPRATEDLHELWRRITFTVLVSNTDDHLRNHSFLRERTDGWSLSPAFDINPDPDPDPGAKRLSTTIDFGNDLADIDLLIDVADAFRLGPEDAIAILRDVLDADRERRQENHLPRRADHRDRPSRRPAPRLSGRIYDLLHTSGVGGYLRPTRR